MAYLNPTRPNYISTSGPSGKTERELAKTPEEQQYERWKAVHEGSAFQPSQPWNPSLEQSFQDRYNLGQQPSGGGGGGSPAPVSEFTKSYPGQYAAPMSEYEKYALERMMGILTGEWDPMESDYFKAFKPQAEQALGDATTRVGQQAAMGGMFLSSPRQDQQRKLQEQHQRDLQSAAVTAQQQEMQNLMGFMGPGALPRQIDQYGLDMQYQDFLRRQGFSTDMIDRIVRLLSMQPGSYSYTVK